MYDFARSVGRARAAAHVLWCVSAAAGLGCAYPSDRQYTPRDGAGQEEPNFMDGSSEGEESEGGGDDVELPPGTCLKLPLEPYRLGGYRFGQSVGSGLVHAGEDVRAAEGTVVRAVAPGKVLFAGPGGKGWGGLVLVQATAPDGTLFVYGVGHLDADTLLVAQSETLSMSPPLGYVASKAKNGGWKPHVHFLVVRGTIEQGRTVRGHVSPKDLDAFDDPVPFLIAHGKCGSAPPACTEGERTCTAAGLKLCWQGQNVTYPCTVEACWQHGVPANWAACGFSLQAGKLMCLCETLP